MDPRVTSCPLPPRSCPISEPCTSTRHAPSRRTVAAESRWAPRGRLRRAAIVGAGARGNHVFAELMRTRATGWEVSAVVEPDAVRRAAFREQQRLPVGHAFASIEEFLRADR